MKLSGDAENSASIGQSIITIKSEMKSELTKVTKAGELHLYGQITGKLENYGKVIIYGKLIGDIKNSGQLIVYGEIVGQITNEIDSVIVLESTGQLSGEPLDNNGTIHLKGTISALVNNNPTGTILQKGGSLAGGIVDLGTLA